MGLLGRFAPGDGFNAWLAVRVWTPGETWEVFASLAREILARENEAHAQRLARQNVGVTNGDRAEVLIAGYLQGELRILLVPCKGDPVWCTDDRPASIGSGMLSVFRVRWEMDSDFRAEAGYLREVLERVAIRRPDTCGPPIRIVEISPQGVQEIV